ncbi:FkbM family methyltransferase [Nocardioides xinjiangensis]|uniref:FkbM family methyltransferase n=1 Tax=Nocardioides xinjiangensis TaxID=2817376 RepID=UPI001B305AB7|nr:FkbM family methyltransferase [Nocardioides sp. SYSU D00778]
MGAVQQRVARYTREVIRYGRESASVRDFARVMQVRLSQSKAGPVVCPRPVVRRVRTRALGEAVLRSHTTDISVLGELLVWDGYERAVAPMPAPRTVLDLGANTGLAALWFLRRWPDAHVVCVEPEVGNVATLRTNLQDLDARIVPHAVGGTRRTAQLTTTNGEFAFTITGTAGQGIPVEVVTMDDVLAVGDLPSIDLLKVDIEGAEAELFADCAGWIDRVRWMVVECHGGYDVEQLLADCKRGGAGFEVTDLDEKPGWGFSVVTARRVGTSSDPLS